MAKDKAPTPTAGDLLALAHRLDEKVEELKQLLLNDVATVHRSLKDYKTRNDSSVQELRGVVESMVRRGRRGQ